MGIPSQMPTGTAPRSSTTGMAEIIDKTAHFGNPNPMKKFAIFWPVCNFSTVPAVFAVTADPELNKVRVTKANEILYNRDFRFPRLAFFVTLLILVDFISMEVFEAEQTSAVPFIGAEGWRGTKGVPKHLLWMGGGEFRCAFRVGGRFSRTFEPMRSLH